LTDLYKPDAGVCWSL